MKNKILSRIRRNRQRRAGAASGTPPVGQFMGMNGQSGFLYPSWGIFNGLGRRIGHLEVDAPYGCKACFCDTDEKDVTVAGSRVLRHCKILNQPGCVWTACPPSPQCPSGGVVKRCSFKVACCLAFFDKRTFATRGSFASTSAREMVRLNRPLVGDSAPSGP